MNTILRKKRWIGYLAAALVFLCSFILLSSDAYAATTVPAQVTSFTSSKLKTTQSWKVEVSGTTIKVVFRDSKASDGTRTLLRINDKYSDWTVISSGSSKMKLDVSKVPNGKYKLGIYEARKESPNGPVWGLAEYQIKVKKGKPVFVFAGGKSESVFYKRLSAYKPSYFNGLPNYAGQMRNLKKIAALTKKLTKKCKSKQEKVKAIHDWLAKNIAYDYESYQTGNIYAAADPDAVFERRRAVCSGYSRLARVMFGLAKIPCLNIHGYANENLRAGSNYGTSNHEWNAVYLNKKWYLIDITWDSLNRYYGAWYGNNIIGQKARYTYYGIHPVLLSTDHCSMGVFNFHDR